VSHIQVAVQRGWHWALTSFAKRLQNCSKTKAIAPNITRFRKTDLQK